MVDKRSADFEVNVMHAGEVAFLALAAACLWAYCYTDRSIISLVLAPAGLGLAIVAGVQTWKLLRHARHR
jgi:hypothetical protein